MKIDPNTFIIARKRKQYRFAQFANVENCFELDEWKPLEGKVCIELGAGTGYFLLELARRYPKRQYVAVDVKADRLQAGARRAVEQDITNILFLRARADQLSLAFAEQSVDELWLTFSDPFPKEKHAKHRMTAPHFLLVYRKLLSKTAFLHMKTDNHPLFDWSLEQLVTHDWTIKALTYDLHNSDAVADLKIQTTFESRYMAGGTAILYLNARA